MKSTGSGGLPVHILDNVYRYVWEEEFWIPISIPPVRHMQSNTDTQKGGKRRIRRWEHENIFNTVQARLECEPEQLQVRMETSEHPFGTLKSWMGYNHFLTRRLPHVQTEMSLHVLAYNLKPAMNLVGVYKLL